MYELWVHHHYQRIFVVRRTHCMDLQNINSYIKWKMTAIIQFLGIFLTLWTSVNSQLLQPPCCSGPKWCELMASDAHRRLVKLAMDGIVYCPGLGNSCHLITSFWGHFTVGTTAHRAPLLGTYIVIGYMAHSTAAWLQPTSQVVLVKNHSWWPFTGMSNCLLVHMYFIGMY